MNWSYYIITKETNQIIGFADNFVEAYNQASEKGINAFVVQGSILTELSAPAPASSDGDDAIEVPEDVFDALEGVEEECQEEADTF